jgi:hypothetical protein
MSALSNFIFANANQGYFGSASPFGDPRDVYINGINQELTTAVTTGQSQTWRSSSILAGTAGDDYLGAYNWTADEVDVLAGGLGADVFVAGDGFGVHYLNVAVSIVADYNYYQGDVVQLSSLGAAGYTYQQGAFGLGNETVDTVLYYNGDPIMALADTPLFTYSFA